MLSINKNPPRDIFPFKFTFKESIQIRDTGQLNFNKTASLSLLGNIRLAIMLDVNTIVRSLLPMISDISIVILLLNFS